MTNHMRDTANKAWLQRTPIEPTKLEIVLAAVFVYLLIALVLIS